MKLRHLVFACIVAAGVAIIGCGSDDNPAATPQTTLTGVAGKGFFNTTGTTVETDGQNSSGSMTSLGNYSATFNKTDGYATVSIRGTFAGSNNPAKLRTKCSGASSTSTGTTVNVATEMITTLTNSASISIDDAKKLVQGALGGISDPMNMDSTAMTAFENNPIVQLVANAIATNATADCQAMLVGVLQTALGVTSFSAITATSPVTSVVDSTGAIPAAVAGTLATNINTASNVTAVSATDITAANIKALTNFVMSGTSMTIQTNSTDTGTQSHTFTAAPPASSGVLTVTASPSTGVDKNANNFTVGLTLSTLTTNTTGTLSTLTITRSGAVTLNLKQGGSLRYSVVIDNFELTLPIYPASGVAAKARIPAGTTVTIKDSSGTTLSAQTNGTENLVTATGTGTVSFSVTGIFTAITSKFSGISTSTLTLEASTTYNLVIDLPAAFKLVDSTGASVTSISGTFTTGS